MGTSVPRLFASYEPNVMLISFRMVSTFLLYKALDVRDDFDGPLPGGAASPTPQPTISRAGSRASNNNGKEMP